MRPRPITTAWTMQILRATVGATGEMVLPEAVLRAAAGLAGGRVEGIDEEELSICAGQTFLRRRAPLASKLARRDSARLRRRLPAAAPSPKYRRAA